MSFPRVCGDVSKTKLLKFTSSLLSPRMRGCFRLIRLKLFLFQAFPAYAGMFLWAPDYIFSGASFPRVCGDVSKEIYAQGTADELSPRMRGCFSSREHK